MAMPVVTVAAGGLPVVDVTATTPKLGLPVTEALNGRGRAVTKVAARGMPVTFVSPALRATTVLTATAGTTLSGGNLTVTKNTASGTYANILSQPSTGAAKLYAEYCLVTQLQAGWSGAGVCSPGFVPGGPGDLGSLGGTADSIGVFDLNVTAGGTVRTPSLLPAVVATHWAGVAVDRLTKTIWFRNITGGGSWTSYSLPALPNTELCMGISLWDLNDAFTLNFDGTFLSAPPAAGYARWGGAML